MNSTKIGKLLAALIAILGVTHAAITDSGQLSCEDGSSAAILFADALNKLSRHPSDTAANQEVNRLLESIIKNKSESGDCALAWLAGHHLGDSGEPECEILSRGTRMIEKLDQVESLGKKLDLPLSTLHSRPKLVEQIRAGLTCAEL